MVGTSIEEREMTRRQRGLVDTCFEEGQYESGITVLDQLRSSSFRPPADHVRQLLYIALFPPPPPTGDQTNQQEQVPPSPTKGSPTKQRPTLAKASYAPSAVESEAAQRVLFSFLATNSTGSLFRALPRYPQDGLADDDIPPLFADNDHDKDSLISRVSLCIKDCKNCWAIFREGFIQRAELLPQDEKKKRGRDAYDGEDADLDQVYCTPAVVAEHAWPILQWLLSLFEKDELCDSRQSGDSEKYSRFLLLQIPPPRGGSGPRWDAGAPLDIVFHSIVQDDGERRDMATRLLILLIHLSHSGSFDELTFATILSTRLYTSSPQIVQNLLESLPKTVPVLTFKILLCQKFLSSAPSIAGCSKPRPRPLAKRGSRREFEILSSTAHTDVGQAGSNLSPRPVHVACSEIFQLVSNDHKPPRTASAPPVLTVKYGLLMSYAHLQGLLPIEEKDSDWQDALSNGGLKHIIDTTFPHDSTYHTALTIVASFWPGQGVCEATNNR